jgi:hypothetical protein
MGRLISAVLLAAMVFVGAVQAEGLHGRSADLGFTFDTPRSPWCDRIIEVVLTAPDIGTYRRNPRELERALGRLRAAALSPSECPIAQMIQVDAKVGGATIMRATMAAFSRWVIVWEPKADGRLTCFDEASADACTSYAEAYRLWREIALSVGAPEVQLSTFLDTHRATQAEWTAPGLSGQVRALPITPEDGASLSVLTQALVENAAETCGANWHLTKEDNISERVVRRAFSCKQSKTTTHEDIVVVERAGFYFVFSSRATAPEPEKLWRFNSSLASTLARIISK